MNGSRGRRPRPAESCWSGVRLRFQSRLSLPGRTVSLFPCHRLRQDLRSNLRTIPVITSSENPFVLAKNDVLSDYGVITHRKNIRPLQERGQDARIAVIIRFICKVCARQSCSPSWAAGVPSRRPQSPSPPAGYPVIRHCLVFWDHMWTPYLLKWASAATSRLWVSQTKVNVGAVVPAQQIQRRACAEVGIGVRQLY